jgi:hypothetical protein
MWESVVGRGPGTHLGRDRGVVVAWVVVLIMRIHGEGVSGVCRVRLVVLHGQVGM